MFTLLSVVLVTANDNVYAAVCLYVEEHVEANTDIESVPDSLTHSDILQFPSSLLLPMITRGRG